MEIALPKAYRQGFFEGGMDLRTVYTGGQVFVNGSLQTADFAVKNGVIEAIGEVFPFEGDTVVSLSGKYVFPGFTDVHVHFREPGFSYKETIETGSKAAAAGGYTLVGTMPNLNPAPDTMETLKKQLDLIREKAVIDVVPYGTISMERKGKTLSDMKGIADEVIGFSDDGSGVDDESLIKEAMKTAKALDKVIAAHSEVLSLVKGGHAHDGEFARENGIAPISSESEWKMAERDIAFIKEIGSKHHVCHISAKETVDLIRNAKKAGADITCETGPHYLIMNDSMLKNEGRYKMNPPIRAEEDRIALVNGILDGTIDMIATDHAPHAAHEKSGTFPESAMGVTGLECAFSMMYTHFVLKGILPIEKLIDLMAFRPRERFGFEKNEIAAGKKADFTVFDPEIEWTVKGENQISLGKFTPFEGWTARGKIVKTVLGDKTVFEL